MPKEHILRKIDKIPKFDEIYEVIEKQYFEDNASPLFISISYVSLFGCGSFLNVPKIVLIDVNTKDK